MDGQEVDVGGTKESLEGEDLETRVQQLEEAMAVIKGDSRLADLPYGTLKQAASMLSLRSIGGTGGAYPASGANLGTPLTTKVYSSNNLYAVPFYMPGVPNTIVKIGIRVTAASGSLARLGIYKDKGEAKFYPHKLLVDLGTVDISGTGVKTITMRREMPRGLAWLAFVMNGSPTLSALLGTSGVWCPLGRTEDGASIYTYILKSFSYAALPDPFPAGGTERSEEVPYIFLKFG